MRDDGYYHRGYNLPHPTMLCSNTISLTPPYMYFTAVSGGRSGSLKGCMQIQSPHLPSHPNPVDSLLERAKPLGYNRLLLLYTSSELTPVGILISVTSQHSVPQYQTSNFLEHANLGPSQNTNPVRRAQIQKVIHDSSPRWQRTAHQHPVNSCRHPHNKTFTEPIAT